MIDLHTHTTFSDGTLTPAELMQKAKNKGITVIAVTDHDTIDALPEAIEAAKKHEIAIIPGLELSIHWSNNDKLHLLGLGVDYRSASLHKSLESIRIDREARNIQILNRMNEAGIKASYPEIKAYAKNKVVGRPHFANFLVDKGIVKNIQAAFTNYLAHGRPFYIARNNLSLEQGVSIITEAQGVPVIAHPSTLHISRSRFKEEVPRFLQAGVRGIEAYHSGETMGSSLFYEELARQYNMIITGGSDYHGENRKDRVLGIGAAKKRVPESCLTYLKHYLIS